LAEFGNPFAVAATKGNQSWYDQTLTRRIFREWLLTGRLHKPGDRNRGGRSNVHFGGKLIVDRRRFGVLKRLLDLFNQPRRPFPLVPTQLPVAAFRYRLSGEEFPTNWRLGSGFNSKVCLDPRQSLNLSTPCCRAGTILPGMPMMAGFV